MMKTILFFIISLFIACPLLAQGKLEIKTPEIQLKNLQADDQTFTQVFQIKNSGDQPVLLTRVTPMTTLLKADWNREPILPGRTGKIQIHFIPMQMPENFNYRILVYSNAGNNRLELKLSGNIIDNPAKPELLYKFDMNGLKFKTTSIHFNKVYTWQTVSDTLYYINTRPEPVTLDVYYHPPYIHTTLLPEKVEAGQKGAILIHYDATQKNDYGYSYDNLILSFNHLQDYENRLSVTANLQEDFSQLSKQELLDAPAVTFNKQEINFGEIRPGEKAKCDFVLKNTGKNTLFVRKIKASCGCTAITLGEKAIASGKSTIIQAIFDSTGKTGKQYKTITVITNDPKNPESTLSIQGTIK